MCRPGRDRHNNQQFPTETHHHVSGTSGMLENRSGGILTSIALTTTRVELDRCVVSIRGHPWLRPDGHVILECIRSMLCSHSGISTADAVIWERHLLVVSVILEWSWSLFGKYLNVSLVAWPPFGIVIDWCLVAILNYSRQCLDKI